MVIVDTSFKKIKSLVNGKLSIKELEETLADMGMELDEIEDDEIKIEITAERTDLITPEGLARAINCYKEYVKGYQEIKVKNSNYVHKVDSSVLKYRPYTRSFVVKNLKFTDENIKSLMWIQEKIHDTYGRKRKKVAIGVYNLDKLNFPITYCAKKPEEIKFIPLGMTKELTGLKILQQHPTGRNYAPLLEGFDKFPLQIDAKKQVLSLPPIINSNDLGKIEKQTKNIFVECTGTDGESLDSIMNILATMFYDWGGDIYSVSIKEKEGTVICPNIKERKNKITTKLIKNLIGIDLKPKEASKLLQKMEYNVTAIKGDEITVTIPSIRTDVWHPVDIADDVARAYGYNNIKPTLPNVSTVGKMLPANILVEDICNFLVGLNLIEIKTFALTNNIDQFTKMNVDERKHISLGKNTEDKNLSMVRCWLIPEAMKSLVANRNREYPQRLFEVGIVVIPDNKVGVKAKNVEKLICLLCEDNVDFTSIKQILDSVMGFLGIKCSIKETEHSSFISGRVGEVLLGNKSLGIIGEIHPQVLDNWDLKVPVAALELDLSELFKILE
jgi:phenylalanyl-tRNA synthetase beta chain